MAQGEDDKKSKEPPKSKGQGGKSSSGPKGGKAQEKPKAATDKAAREAERAARKAANIAERESRKQGRPAAAGAASEGKSAKAEAAGDSDKAALKADRIREREERQAARRMEREQKGGGKKDGAGKAKGKSPEAVKNAAEKAIAAKPRDKASQPPEKAVAKPEGAKAQKGVMPAKVAAERPSEESVAKQPTSKQAAPAARPTQPVSPTAPAQLAKGSSAPVPFNILIVAQAGPLAAQAVLFAASLRRNAPGFKGRLIVAEPRSEGAWQGSQTQIPDAARKALLGYGAEILPFTARHFGRAYPYGNKIEALPLLPAKEPFIFFDSDTLILGPIDEVAIPFSRPSASMRREGSWPEPPLYGPDYAEIWKSVYERFGVDFEASRDYSFSADYWEHYLYFNAGWFFGADPHEFGRRFTDAAVRVRKDPGEALACQSLDPWLDQIVLPVVIQSLGGGRPGAELSGFDGALTCHYRNLSLLYARESEAAIACFEALAAEPAIADLLKGREDVTRLIAQGEGRSKVRALFADGLPTSEQAIRHQLRKAELWFR